MVIEVTNSGFARITIENINSALDNQSNTLEQSYILYILEKINTDQSSQIVATSIEKPVESKAFTSFCNLEDGLYKVYLILVPSEDLIKNSCVNANNIYYSDGKTLFLNNTKIGNNDINLCDSNLIYLQKYIFMLDNLKSKFAEISKKMLPAFKNTKHDILVRDILWVGIDVIEYCIDKDEFFLANQRLELVVNCVFGAYPKLMQRTWPPKPGSGCTCQNRLNNAYKLFANIVL